MAKVTSKLQVTLPKALAGQFHIRPGDEIKWEAAGDVIRIVPASRQVTADRATRLRWFDMATQRQQRRAVRPAPEATSRGWRREDLYRRGRSG